LFIDLDGVVICYYETTKIVLCVELLYKKDLSLEKPNAPEFGAFEKS